MELTQNFSAYLSGKTDITKCIGWNTASELESDT